MCLDQMNAFSGNILQKIMAVWHSKVQCLVEMIKVLTQCIGITVHKIWVFVEFYCQYFKCLISQFVLISFTNSMLVFGETNERSAFDSYWCRYIVKSFCFQRENKNAYPPQTPPLPSVTQAPRGGRRVCLPPGGSPPTPWTDLKTLPSLVVGK